MSWGIGGWYPTLNEVAKEEPAQMVQVNFQAVEGIPVCGHCLIQRAEWTAAQAHFLVVVRFGMGPRREKIATVDHYGNTRISNRFEDLSQVRYTASLPGGMAKVPVTGA